MCLSFCYKNTLAQAVTLALIYLWSRVFESYFCKKKKTKTRNFRKWKNIRSFTHIYGQRLYSRLNNTTSLTCIFCNLKIKLQNKSISKLFLQKIQKKSFYGTFPTFYGTIEHISNTTLKYTKITNKKCELFSYIEKGINMEHIKAK